MADEVDLAQEQIEASLAHAIRQNARRPRLQPTGFCHNCEAPLPTGWMFCDALCRQDFDRVEAANLRSGNIGR